MTSSEGNEAEMPLFPTVNLLRSQANAIRQSIINAGIETAPFEFMIMSVLPALQALEVAHQTTLTLTSELKSLQESYAKPRATRNQTDEKNDWLNQTSDESHTSSANLVSINNQLRSQLSAALAKEAQLLDRMEWMEKTVRKLSGLIVKNRVGSYQSIELWVDQTLSKPLDQATEDYRSDYGDHDQAFSQQETTIKMGESSVKAESDIAVDPANPQPSLLTEKLWDDAFSNTKESERDIYTKDDDAVSQVSEFSIFTDIVKYRVIQSKVPRELMIALRRNDNIEGETLNNRSIPTSTADIQDSIASTSTSTTIGQAGPDICNDRSSKSVDKDIPLKETNIGLSVRTSIKPTAPSVQLTIHQGSPSSVDEQQHHLAKSPQQAQKQQSVNTCEDNTRYADIARVFGNDNPIHAHAINPQVVFADPDEVAGAWNDVPVPVELRPSKSSGKFPEIPKASERGILMIGLPPTITVAMLAKFVRGGKVESISIINEGKDRGIKKALIKFFSKTSAKKFYTWMERNPRLMIDGYPANPFLRRFAPPPVVPHGGGSRVLKIRKLPREIETEEAFLHFIKRTAYKYQLKIHIQEARIHRGATTDGERYFSASVIFDSYHMGLEMSRIFTQKLMLNVVWGHDPCEDQIVDQRVFNFIEHKKQDEDESD